MYIPECPLGTLGMPALPDYMSCHYKDTCTGIECCIEISGLGLTLHPFLLIDPCEYSLSYGVNTINRTIQLINYEWGLYFNSHYLIKTFKRKIPSSFEIKRNSLVSYKSL